jgi:hypothetical protein
VNLRLLAVVVVSTIVFSSVDFATSQSQERAQPQVISGQEAELSMLRSMSENVRQVARILRDHHVEIDASLLFTIDGRKNVRPQLSAIPDMNLSKVQTGSLGGLVLAHDLTLPEQTSLDADTVIIANNVVFNGKFPDISGPHAFHMFALDSVILKSGDETVVTIDTSGFAGEDGLDNRAGDPGKRAIDALKDLRAFQSSDKNLITINTSGDPGQDAFGYGASEDPAKAGYIGSSGESGLTGSVGKSGSCDTGKDGGTGEPGTDGLPGSMGGDGVNGTDGSDAHPQTIMIGGITGGYFRIIAKGGKGGDGGSGGRGGVGGKGGNGGPGGNGVGCKCSWDGLGEGGTGGMSGAGGVGGAGGPGGNGGAGGKGASIAIIIPGTYYNRLKQYSGAGTGGRGGRGGQGGMSGSSGIPGEGGEGASLTGCGRGRARNGSPGSHVNPTAPSKAGHPGQPGKPGDPGSLSWTFSDERSR